MQPYERRRTGALAGTTGSRAPSFPTDIAAEGYAEPVPVALTAPRPAEEETEVVPETARSIIEAPRPPAATARPKGINGVWITYEGKRWFSAGKAVPRVTQFQQSGMFQGFPVYRRPDTPDTIYIPTADGMVAPYRIRR
jgi:hypothetical protein